MGYTAIFGGTFNPFHKGHYAMLEALADDDSINEIFIMPDRIPPHKVCDYMPSDNDRIEMCRLIAEEFDKAKVCLIEFERQGKSYSYDTVLELQSQYPDKEFVFVCGGDMFVYFPKWFKYEDLMKLLPFYVFSRVGTDFDEFKKCLEEFKQKGMKIILNNALIPNISSTDFRNSKNASLLPKKIYDYIKTNGIYDVR